MAELTDDEYRAATARGEIAYATLPRALSARFDPADERIVVELANGSTFAFPARLAQGLEHATPEELAEVEVGGVGFGLHWGRLDADHLLEALLAGRFGSDRYMVERFGPGWDAAAAE